MKFEPASIPDVVQVFPQVFGDARGFLMETWHARKLAEAGIGAQFVQENLSRSAAGVLRGMHYQIQRAQGKLVRALRGRVYDVAVDIRRSSATFGQWVGVWLSEEERNAVWIPAGFAHGFYVAEDAEVLYACTDFHAPEHERSIRWDDPEIGIDWPLGGKRGPSLSKKDATGLSLAQAELYP